MQSKYFKWTSLLITIMTLVFCQGVFARTSTSRHLEAKRVKSQLADICKDQTVKQKIKESYLEFSKHELDQEKQRRAQRITESLRKEALFQLLENKTHIIPTLSYAPTNTSFLPVVSSCKNKTIDHKKQGHIAYQEIVETLEAELLLEKALGSSSGEHFNATLWHGIEAAILEFLSAKHPWRNDLVFIKEPIVTLNYKQKIFGPLSERLSYIYTQIPILNRPTPQSQNSPVVNNVASALLKEVVSFQPNKLRNRINTRVTSYRNKLQLLELENLKDQLASLNVQFPKELPKSKKFKEKLASTLAWKAFFETDFRQLVLEFFQTISQKEIQSIKLILGVASADWLSEMHTVEKRICNATSFSRSEDSSLIARHLQGKSLVNQTLEDLSVLCQPSSILSSFKEKPKTSSAALIRTLAYGGLTYTLVSGPLLPVTIATATLFSSSYLLRVWDQKLNIQKESALFGIDSSKRTSNRLSMLYNGFMTFASPGLTFTTSMALGGAFNNWAIGGFKPLTKLTPGWHFLIPNPKDNLEASLTTAATAWAAGKRFMDEGQNPFFAFPYWADLFATYMSTIWTLGPLNIQGGGLQTWVVKSGISLGASFGAYFLMDDSISGLQEWSSGKQKDPRFAEYVMGWVPKYTVGHMLAKGVVKATLSEKFGLLREAVSLGITYSYYCFSYSAVATFFQNPEMSIDDAVAHVLQKFKEDPYQMFIGWNYRIPKQATSGTEETQDSLQERVLEFQTKIDANLVQDLLSDISR